MAGMGGTEVRSKREETMRTMRWAAELSAQADGRLANLGVAELAALLESEAMVRRSAATGRAVSASVQKIANAQLRPLDGHVVAAPPAPGS
jgi:hypothetical protein